MINEAASVYPETHEESRKSNGKDGNSDDEAIVCGRIDEIRSHTGWRFYPRYCVGIGRHVRLSYE